MTIFLTPQQVLFIHARLIDTTGGEHGLRDLGLLESAVARPQATFDGNELYPTIFLKTAALMDSLAHNHPFVDGNKRSNYGRCPILAAKRPKSPNNQQRIGKIHNARGQQPSRPGRIGRMVPEQFSLKKKG